MPLDPNIFFQGAALKQANDQRLQSTIGGLVDRLQQQRMMEQDPERMLRRAVARTVAGEGTPEDEALIKFESILKGGETKYMPDEHGNVRAVTQPTLYDRLYGSGGPSTYQPQYPATGDLTIPTMTTEEFENPKTGSMSTPADISNPLTTADLNSDIFSGGEEGIDLKRIADAKNKNAERVNQPAMDLSPSNAFVSKTPAGQKKAFETDEAIRQKKAEANINVATKKEESYATKTGQIQAENEAKLPAIRGFIQELESFGEENVKKLPSGLAGSIAAKATNIAGLPNQQALAQADLDSILPTLMGQAKQITRQAGEGTFTDYDAQALEKMIWNDADSLPVKVKKYNTILGAMKRAEERLTGQEMPSTNAPQQDTNNIDFLINKYAPNKQ